jgi:sulfoxide reductase heme-binding subunit YedZ
VSPLDYPFWLASRSAGVVAYLLLSGSVILGLAMATRLVPARDLRVLHERIALLALGAVAAHGLLLLPDGWLHPGLTQILIPFTNGYRPLWTGLGILAAYGAAGLSLTYYARRRLGHRRWRAAHRFIPIAWALAAAHVIGAGTDAVSLWLQVILAATIHGSRLLTGASPSGCPSSASFVSRRCRGGRRRRSARPTPRPSARSSA